MLFQLDASNRLFAGLIADADYIKENFISYLQSFSDNVKDIIQRFDFFKVKNKAIEIAKKLKSSGMASQDIVNFTGLSKQEIEQL